MNGGEDDVIPLDVLPPAIGADSPASIAPPEDEEVAPKPRRRSRAPRPAADDDDIAPAA
jgi:hypothetical protein